MVESNENRDHFYCHRCQRWRDIVTAVPTHRDQKLELVCPDCMKAPDESLVHCAGCGEGYPAEDLTLTYGEPATTSGNLTYVYKCRKCMGMGLPPDEGPRYGS
jgi:hypothetical protein